MLFKINNVSVCSQMLPMYCNKIYTNLSISELILITWYFYYRFPLVFIVYYDVADVGTWYSY